jgi:adenosylcobinamide amidohydrolase
MRPRLQTHATTDRARPVLVWRSPRPVLMIASGAFGGGMGLRSWIVNAEVPKAYDRLDLADHAAELKEALGLAGDGVMLLTAASVDRHAGADDAGVTATATVGLTTPTWAAAPDGDAGAWQPARPGTINVVAWVPVRLSLAALVGAVGTVTEAKVQALVECGVDGSGTASDAVCVACPPDGPVETFGGVRSEWGARLARAVHAAVRTGAQSAP